MSMTDQAYLFVHFSNKGKEEDENIYFALSQDGLHWQDLGGDKPALTSSVGTKGIRDPFMVFDEKLSKYFIIATDLCIAADHNWENAVTTGSRSILVWESEDLIHWSKEKMIEVGIPTAGCVWAPEAIYCKEKSQWFVFWASNVKEEGDLEAKQRIYGAFTKDFHTFTPTQKYLEAPQHVIDTDIVWHDGWYYRFSKDETYKVITLERSRELISDHYEKIESKLLSTMEGVEGPECYYLKEAGKWCLIVDQYRIQGGYLPLLTDDLSTGEFVKADPSEYDLGSRKKRHGGVITISTDEAKRMIEFYGVSH